MASVLIVLIDMILLVVPSEEWLRVIRKTSLFCIGLKKNVIKLLIQC